MKRGAPIELTQVEYLIMKSFLENRGRALSRDDLLDMVWGYDYQGDIRTVDVHITHLRKKLGEYGKIIVNRSGYGYCIEL